MMKVMEWAKAAVEKHGWKHARRICKRHEFGENNTGAHRHTGFYQKAIAWIEKHAPAGAFDEETN